MNITLLPTLYFALPPFAVSKHGDILTINDSEYDLSAIPEGGTLPASALNNRYVIGGIDRIGGQLHLTMILPLPSNAGEILTKSEIQIALNDGPLEMPQ